MNSISYEHCTDKSCETTNWEQIAKLYNWLCKIAPSPVTEMNCSIAIMQLEGAESGLRSLQAIDDRKKLESFYLYYALLGDIYVQLKDSALAIEYYGKALSMTKSEAEKRMLQKKIDRGKISDTLDETG